MPTYSSIEKGYEKELEQLFLLGYTLDQADHIILRMDAKSSIQTLIETHDLLRRTLAFDDIVSIAAHSEGGKHIDAYIKNTFWFHIQGFNQKQVIAMLSCDNGSEKLAMLRANLNILQGLGFSIAEMARMMCIIDKVEKLVLLIKNHVVLQAFRFSPHQMITMMTSETDFTIMFVILTEHQMALKELQVGAVLIYDLLMNMACPEMLTLLAENAAALKDFHFSEGQIYSLAMSTRYTANQIVLRNFDLNEHDIKVLLASSGYDQKKQALLASRRFTDEKISKIRRLTAEFSGAYIGLEYMTAIIENKTALLALGLQAQEICFMASSALFFPGTLAELTKHQTVLMSFSFTAAQIYRKVEAGLFFSDTLAALTKHQMALLSLGFKADDICETSGWSTSSPRPDFMWNWSMAIPETYSDFEADQKRLLDIFSERLSLIAENQAMLKRLGFPPDKILEILRAKDLILPRIPIIIENRAFLDDFGFSLQQVSSVLWNADCDSTCNFSEIFSLMVDNQHALKRLKFNAEHLRELILGEQIRNKPLPIKLLPMITKNLNVLQAFNLNADKIVTMMRHRKDPEGLQKQVEADFYYSPGAANGDKFFSYFVAGKLASLLCWKKKGKHEKQIVHIPESPMNEHGLFSPNSVKPPVDEIIPAQAPTLGAD